MQKIKTSSFDLAIYQRGNKNAEKIALILPGQLDTKDYPHMRGYVDFLAKKGYLAISFDPPGTWESPGDIKIYTMTNYLKAINELIEHFGNKPTFLIGHSRGGSMAMLAGITNPKVFAFCAIMSGYTYDPEIHTRYNDSEWETKGYKESWRDLPENPAKKRLFRLPWNFVLDQRQYDMANDLSKCTKPKLFIMGTRDTTAAGELVIGGYEIAAKPKQLYKLDSDHDYRWHPELIEEVNQVVENFLVKNT